MENFNTNTSQNFVTNHADTPPLLIVETNNKHETYVYSHGLTTANEPISTKSIFRIGSLTKIFTTISVLKLVEEGHFGLDDAISDYIPELKEIRIISTNTDLTCKRLSKHEISIRQLLLHTSGFTYDFTNDLTRLFNQTHFGESIAPIVYSEPGKIWCYGSGTEWLGKLVEMFGGVLPTYLNNHIFKPANMVNTSYNVAPKLHHKVVPTLYKSQHDAVTIHSKYKNLYDNVPAGDGGLFSTGQDIINFLKSLMSEDTFRLTYGLSEKTYKLIVEPQQRIFAKKSTQCYLPHLSNNFDFINTNNDSWTSCFVHKPNVNSDSRQAVLFAGGMFNTYIWLNLSLKKCGIVFSNILPFCDKQILSIALHRSSMTT